MLEAEATRWLRCRRPRSAPRLRLLCIPFAGGGASVFHTWADSIGVDIEVRAVQLPGRQERFAEAAPCSVTAAVTGIAEALLALPALPLVVYGHSHGAAIAFELARSLRGLLQCPLALVVAARAAPHCQRKMPRISGLPTADFKDALHRTYAVPREVLDNPELMELALPPLRADFLAVETYKYVPAAPLDIPIIALHGTKDELVARNEMMAWREVTASTMSLFEVDAGHLFLETHQPWVLDCVAATIRSVMPRATQGR